MKYLFFDIECANCFDHCGKIYSFGYVLCDENFNLLEQRDVLMNPKVDKWDFYVKKKILAYPVSQVEACDDFGVRSQQIFGLLTDPDVTVFGFALLNDVKFLFDEAKRYDVAPPLFVYYDVQSMLKIKENSKMPSSLERAYTTYCGEEPQKLHRSDCDALNTMLLLKALCKAENTSPKALAEKLGYKPHNSAERVAKPQKKNKTNPVGNDQQEVNNGKQRKVKS